MRRECPDPVNMPSDMFTPLPKGEGSCPGTCVPVAGIPRPALFSRTAEELSLSGAALAELMAAVLAKGAPFRFRAKGWSMQPFIRDGDVITVVPLAPSVPGPGDVVAFLRPETGRPVVHRVVARRGDGWLVRGDGVPGEADGVVRREEMLGRVVRVERAGRAVRLGLGPERRLIAFLSRVGLLGLFARLCSLSAACGRPDHTCTCDTCRGEPCVRPDPGQRRSP